MATITLTDSATAAIDANVIQQAYNRLSIYTDSATTNYRGTSTTPATANFIWADTGGNYDIAGTNYTDQTATTIYPYWTESLVWQPLAQPQPQIEPVGPPKPTPQVIADARGQDLLKDIIGDVLYHRFKKQGHIDVNSVKKPGVRYRIRPWREIELLEKNAKKEWVPTRQTLCIHPAKRHVEGDEVASHVMLCRFDEELLWKVANLHGRRAA